MSLVVALAGEHLHTDGALQLLERPGQGLLCALGDPVLVDVVCVAQVVVQTVAFHERLVAVRTLQRVAVMLLRQVTLYVDIVAL